MDRKKRNDGHRSSYYLVSIAFIHVYSFFLLVSHSEILTDLWEHGQNNSMKTSNLMLLFVLSQVDMTQTKNQNVTSFSYKKKQVVLVHVSTKKPLIYIILFNHFLIAVHVWNHSDLIAVYKCLCVEKTSAIVSGKFSIIPLYCSVCIVFLHFIFMEIMIKSLQLGLFLFCLARNGDMDSRLSVCWTK